MRQRFPIRHLRADRAVGADRRAVADARRRVHRRRGIDVGGARLDRHEQFHLGDRLPAHERRRLRLGQARSRAPERHLEPQAIARHDLAAELRVVDAAQRHARGPRALAALEDQHRRDLRQRLDHQHGGHERHAREVSLEEFFVDGDVLERDEPVARLVLPDGVDQK